MNRRTFLSALAATSLTPLVPAQIFASGGIDAGVETICMLGVTTKSQAYRIGRSVLFQVMADDGQWRDIGISDAPVDVVTAVFMNGDEKPWRGGLITT